MSNLLVQNIKHTNNTSAQTIDTSGRTTAVLNNDTTYRSDNGAVTQNKVQGLCKVWHDSNAAGSTLNDNFNVSSLGDTATGKQTINLTNAMSNATYSCCVVLNDGNMRQISAVGRATGSYRTEVYSTTNTSYHDEPTGSQVVGDLA